MLYDIIFVAIIVIFTVIGIKRKASKTLRGLAVIVLAFFCALWLSNLFGSLFYDSFVRGGIVNLVNDRITSANVETNENLIDVVLGAIPTIAFSILGYFGSNAGDIETYLAQEATGGSEYIAESVGELLKAPISGVISFVLLIIFFIIFVILFNLISRPLLKLFNLPVISTFDSILGGVFGVLEGILAVMFCAVLIHLLLPTVSGNIYIFTEEYIDQSFVMQFMFTGSFASMIQTWIYDVEKLVL